MENDPNSFAWYESLRARYRSNTIRIPLTGESSPDPGDGDRRSLYSPLLNVDNLDQVVAETSYGPTHGFNVSGQVANLQRKHGDGIWLIDSAAEPVNAKTSAARRRAIRSNVHGPFTGRRTIPGEIGVTISQGVIYAEVSRPLPDAGVAVLHKSSLPFPLGNTCAQFVARARRALTDIGLRR